MNNLLDMMPSTVCM